MHIIWENLTATIILMGLVLVLVVVNARNQETLTEATAYYALKSQGLAFAEVLKRDLQGVDRVYTHAEVDSVFHFRAFIGQDTTQYEVKYQRRRMAQRTVMATDEQGRRFEKLVDFYQVNRYVRRPGTSTWLLSGGSVASLTDWEIQTLNEQNAALGASDDLENCRKVRVRFEAVSPFIQTKAVDRMRWESTFTPPSRSRTSVL